MGSGGSSHETPVIYAYVDPERERREAEEKEARRVKEMEENIGKERLKLKEEAKAEEARQQKQYRQRREQEIAEEKERGKEEKQKRRLQGAELSKRRDELLNYKFGIKTRLVHILGLEIQDVTQLRIGVFGPTGSGKSCFINTCERTVRQTEKGSAPDSTTGNEGTITLQDYLPECFFRLVDTRGFFNYNFNETVEFENILYGRIQPGDNIMRATDSQVIATQEMHQKPKFSQRLHGIILVVKANDPRLRKGALKEYLQPVRDILEKAGILPITVVTHRDILKTEEECTAALNEATAATGSSASNTFFVWNYTKDNRERNPEVEKMAYDILHHALMTAETTVMIMKQKENKKEDEMMKVAPDNADASVDVFLRFLQREYQWSAESVQTSLSKLAEDDITTVRLLAMCWEDVKGHFKVGMRKMIEEELRKRKMIPWTSQ